MDVYKTYQPSELLQDNPYPGRGIMVGKSKCGRFAMIAYFIMGRSDNSRNRIFEEKENGEVIIYPFDASKVQNPSLIIYSPIKKCGNSVIVTNGNQTDTIEEFLKEGKSFEDALDTREFEPDGPAWTPRISSILNFADGDFTYKMSMLKSGDLKGSQCFRYTYSYSPIAGLGHFIHTYNTDGDPIPTFTGEPRRIEVTCVMDTWTNEIWNSLNEANKVSLCTMKIDLETLETETRIINKNN